MNDWSLERLIAWRNELKICSMFFFEQLKRWKVERLNDWMLVQMHFFQCFITLTDWTIERLKDNGNLNIHFLWRFERLNDWRIMEIEMCSSNLKDGMIEGLKDWTIMEFKMYKIIFLKDWTIERYKTTAERFQSLWYKIPLYFAAVIKRSNTHVPITESFKLSIL